MQILPQPISSALQYIFEHLWQISSPAFVWAVLKAGRAFGKIEDRVLAAEAHITKMATNEMPHMQAALQDIQKSNDSAAKSLATLVERTPKRASKARASK